eukprot:766727-Hanusia_phi.AAC.5
MSHLRARAGLQAQGPEANLGELPASERVSRWRLLSPGRDSPPSSRGSSRRTLDSQPACSCCSSAR